MKKSGAGHDIGPKEEVSEELNEALETIETLRKDLNEVNLLNAKLLYVNKVFKANNLTESQKATVIAAFDKAETVKEVKLVFETVSENIPSGVKKEVVKEAKGFASAAAGTSDRPEVITEANQAVLRLQKLAGIIK
jgi:N-dimethylarginine dimethylaminohydrolase